MEIKTFHELVYSKFVEKLESKSNDSKILTRNEIKHILGSVHKLPKPFQYSFMKEMEHLNLIKVIDKQNIEILDQQKINL